MAKNKYKLTICDSTYIISTDQDESEVILNAEQVSKDVDNILKINPRLSTTQACVLTALDYCDNLQKAKSSNNNLREQIGSYIDENNLLRSENNKLKKDYELLKKECEKLALQSPQATATPVEEPVVKQVETKTQKTSDVKPVANVPFANNSTPPKNLTAEEFMSLCNELTSNEN